MPRWPNDLSWRLGLCVVATLALASPGVAQNASRATQLPPTRPSTGLVPATAPPATAPPAPSHSGVPSDDADLDPDHPPVLPPAPRAKMHSCGREWQDMKRRGADREMTWRQFATACLQRG